MNLIINGKPSSYDNESFNVKSLLDELGLAGKPVVVELNRQAVLPAVYAETDIPDNSELEIVTIAAGG